MSPFIGLDLFILNENVPKVGYFVSENTAPGVSNDGLSLKEDEGNLIMPIEIFHCSERKLTFFMMRTGALHGKGRHFRDELLAFTKSSGFSNVIILSSTINPVRKERESNRQ